MLLPLIVSVVASASTLSPSFSLPSSTEPSAPPRFELGVLSEPLQGDLAQAALQWGLTHRARYGLSPLATLRVADGFQTRFGASVHLQVVVGKLDVYGQKLVVTLDDSARVTQVSSSLSPVTVVDTHFAIDEAEALRRASVDVPMVVFRKDATALPAGGTAKMLFDVGGELHAGYLVHLLSLDPRRNWYVEMDATTGARLAVQDRTYHAAADAQIYAVSPGGLDAGVGAVPTIAGQLVHGDGGAMFVPVDGGFLEGTQIDAWNCCPVGDLKDDAGVVLAECYPDAGTKHSQGTLNYGGYNLAYDVAVCNRKRLASNDPSRHASGDFVYTPVDPPVNKTVVDPRDPANSDPFAEVHAFYHVNKVYDWVRHLSSKAAPIFPSNTPVITPFKMRDAKRVPARKPAVWANVMFPNFQELYATFPCGVTIPGLGTFPPCKTDHLARVDNAAFMPREQVASLGFPEYDLGVDTLMIFQGNSADAAYDSTVLQHEFGHGVVTSTAGLLLDAIAMDLRSANNEAGALHEGFSDYIAGAYNNLAENGPYFGPRALAAAAGPGVKQESFLRTMDNTFTCPNVLWGEVHQDSQHVSAALWKARKGSFQGTDNGDTFDAAFYAMLVSISPSADFAEVAASMSAKVQTAFGGTANQTMTQIFTDKGVIGCGKVIDAASLSGPREYYGIATAPSSLKTSLIPGPVQFKLRAANGVGAIRASGKASGGGFNPLGGAPQISVLVKVGSPITFTKQSSSLVNDSDAHGDAAIDNGGNLTATVADKACGAHDVYVTIASQGGGGVIQGLSLTVEPPSSTDCTSTPDAGSGGGGGTDTTTVPSVGDGGTLSGATSKTGCGCTSGIELVPAVALLALLRRRRASSPR